MQKRYFRNEEIRANFLLVVDEEGKKVGEMSKAEALKLAEKEGKDLVLINWQVKPPIAKIIEYGKFLYQLKKKEKARKKQKELKEVRISFNIGEHDLQTKRKQIEKFLTKGHRVRIFMFLRGRENVFKQEALAKIEEFARSFEGKAKIEIPPRIQGNVVSVQLAPVS